jgi:ABC-type transporter Mla subunit MlaD
MNPNLTSAGMSDTAQACLVTRARQRYAGLLAALTAATGVSGTGAVFADNDEQQRQASAATLSIARATWDDARKRLNVAGTSTPQATVSLVNAYDPSQLLGSDTSRPPRQLVHYPFTAGTGALPGAGHTG